MSTSEVEADCSSCGHHFRAPVQGRHRLLCGDARKPDDLARLMMGGAINVAVTSPPYAAQRAYDETSGFRPVPPDEYVAWFEAVQAGIAAYLAPDGSFFLNIKEHAEDGQRVLYVKDLTLAHARQWGWRFVDEFAWTREGLPGGWGNRFKNGWEPIFHFCRQAAIRFRAQHVLHASDRAFKYQGPLPPTSTGNVGWKNVDHLDEGGQARPSNVLEFSTNRQSVGHSAAFPVALPEFFVLAFSDPGDVVFDPFMGSGSTLIAAERTGRRAVGVEISPAYCDVIVTRWEKFTGKKAVRDAR